MNTKTIALSLALLFVLAFAIRFGVSFALYQLGFVSVIGDDDATGWQGGALLADHWSVAHLSVGEWLTSVTTVFSKQNLGYQYFLGKIADWQEVWTMGDDHGYRLMSDGQHELVPVWPAEAYAAAFSKEGQSPKQITLRDWIDKWLPGMKKDGRKVAVFPIASGHSAIVDPDRLLSELQQYLDAYE